MYNIITYNGSLFTITFNGLEVFSGNTRSVNFGITQNTDGTLVIVSDYFSYETTLQNITLNGVSYNSLTLLRQALNATLFPFSSGGSGSVSGSGVWGMITGVIGAQTDLQQQFSTYTPTSSFNNYSSSIGVISSSFDSRINANSQSINALSSSYINFSGSQYRNDSSSFNTRINNLTGSGGTGIWGNITGNIQNQTDLQNQFSQYTTTSSFNTYSSSIGTISSSFDNRINQKLNTSSYITDSSSFDSRITTNSSSISSLSSSYKIDSASFNTRINNLTGSGGSGVWGGITGDINNQTDLINKFSTYTTTSSFNTYSSSIGTISSSFDSRIIANSQSINLLSSSFNLFKLQELGFTDISSQNQSSIDTLINNNVYYMYSGTVGFRGLPDGQYIFFNEYTSNGQYQHAYSLTLSGSQTIPNKYTRFNTGSLSSTINFQLDSTGSGGSGVWGGITGDINNQTDLINKFSQYTTTSSFNTYTSSTNINLSRSFHDSEVSIFGINNTPPIIGTDYNLSGSNINITNTSSFDLNFIKKDLGNVWSLVPGTTGYYNSFIQSGTNIIAGTDNGVQISINNGTSFINTQQSTGVFQSFTLSGSKVFGGTSVGIYSSSDMGSTWGITSQNTGNFLSLTTSGSNIFAGSSFGLYSSTNGGSSFSLTSLTSVYVNSVFYNSTTNTMFVGTQTSGVYKSTDGGNTWSNSVISSGNYTSFTSLGSIMFACSSTGVYKSSDNGVTWTQTTAPNYYYTSIININDVLIVSTNLHGILKSVDEGVTWVQTTQTTTSFNTLFQSTSKLLGGTPNGVYTSNNTQNTYENKILISNGTGSLVSTNPIFTDTLLNKVNNITGSIPQNVVINGVKDYGTTLNINNINTSSLNTLNLGIQGVNTITINDTNTSSSLSQNYLIPGITINTVTNSSRIIQIGTNYYFSSPTLGIYTSTNLSSWRLLYSISTLFTFPTTQILSIQTTGGGIYVLGFYLDQITLTLINSAGTILKSNFISLGSSPYFANFCVDYVDSLSVIFHSPQITGETRTIYRYSINVSAISLTLTLTNSFTPTDFNFVANLQYLSGVIYVISSGGSVYAYNSLNTLLWSRKVLNDEVNGSIIIFGKLYMIDFSGNIGYIDLVDLNPVVVGNFNNNGYNEGLGITLNTNNELITLNVNPSGQIDINKILFGNVATQVSINGPLSVTGSSTLNGPLSITGTSTLNGSSTINGPLSVTGTSSFTGQTTFKNSIYLSGSAIIDSTGTMGTAGQYLTTNGTQNVYTTLTIGQSMNIITPSFTYNQGLQGIVQTQTITPSYNNIAGSSLSAVTLTNVNSNCLGITLPAGTYTFKSIYRYTYVTANTTILHVFQTESGNYTATPAYPGMSDEELGVGSPGDQRQLPVESIFTITTATTFIGWVYSSSGSTTGQFNIYIRRIA